MGAYKYKTEEGHQRHLEKRREYYAKNREKIRERDNESARRNRAKDPERYRSYVLAFKERHKNDRVTTTNLENNPDSSEILGMLV